MRRTYLYAFSIGFIIGIILLLASLSLFRNGKEHLSGSGGNQGERRRLTADAVLVQAGQPIGELKDGTILWYAANQVSPGRMQLVLEWRSEQHDKAWLRSVDDGSSAERQATAILEPRQ